jgi:sec-independent protein translocase protein TatA
VDLFAPGHLIPLLIVVAILFFGWKQLPDMARSVGKSLRIFKTEMKGMGDDDAARDAHKVPPAEPAAIPPAAAPPLAPPVASGPPVASAETPAPTAPTRVSGTDGQRSAAG